MTSLFSTAYGKAAAITNAKSGFRKTGIWPVNADINHLKTSCSLSQRPPVGLSQNQMETSTPIQDQVRMSHVLLLHILKLKKVKNQVSPAQTKKTPTPSIVTHNERKYVPIQTISPVLLAAEMPKRDRENQIMDPLY
jgi:hypothetical protein